jgi:carbon storage regulator
MLVLTRGRNDEIVIGDNVRVKVLGVNGSRVRLGVTAPLEVCVDRGEVRERRAEWREGAKQQGERDLNYIPPSAAG